MMSSRRRTALVLVGLLAAAGVAWAQTFPPKPVTLVVPYAVGGTTDIVGRLIATQLGNGLGQPIVVENRTGAGGNGTNTHLGAELFKREAQVDLVHVPYKGAGAVLQDLMGGPVQALVTSLPTALPHLRSGRLRALVVNRATRSSLLPDVPSAPEAGLPRFVMDFWVGVAAPAGTPQPVIDTLNRVVAAAMTPPDGLRRLAEQGLEPETNTPAQAAEFVAAEMQQWAAIVKSAGIKAD